MPQQIGGEGFWPWHVRIVIDGVASLKQCRHAVVADRIEAGTFALSAAMTQGKVTLKNMRPEHLAALFSAMAQACRC